LWGLTPREFKALESVHRDAQDIQRYGFATIQAMLTNKWCEANGLPYEPEDFLKPGRREKRQTERIKETMQGSGLMKNAEGTAEPLPDWATRENVWKP
jgi:hypothetical protein